MVLNRVNKRESIQTIRKTVCYGKSQEMLRVAVSRNFGPLGLLVDNIGHQE